MGGLKAIPARVRRCRLRTRKPVARSAAPGRNLAGVARPVLLRWVPMGRCRSPPGCGRKSKAGPARKRLAEGRVERGGWRRCRRSEEHKFEVQSVMGSADAVFCLKKKKEPNTQLHN